MNFSSQSIKQLQELYLKRYGMDLSEEGANNLGAELVSLFKLIYKPIPKAYAWETAPIVPVYEIE